jgi:hypothetical protein
MKQTHAPGPYRYCSPNSLVRKFRDLMGLSFVIISLLCSGCFRHFYSTNTANQIDSASLVKLIDAQKYFILHDLTHNRQYALNNIKLSNESLVAEKASLPSEHELYEHPAKPDRNAFPAKNQDLVLYEVHLYTQNTGTDSLHVNIPLKDFSRVDVYELDKKSTNKSKVGSIIGVTLTTGAIIAVIITASETSTKVSTANNNNVAAKDISCSPQVFITNQGHAELQGTLYSGAIAASLKRSDYLPLALTEHPGNKIRMTIMGKDEEDIMLNSVQLMQVTHKENDQVLIDRKGNVLVYNNPVQPVQASIGPGQDIRSDVMARDGKYYSFTNNTEEGYSGDILLSFIKPSQSTSGKLIINAKNSAWSYYLFNQFKSLYGNYYPDLILKKDKAVPTQVMQCELDQFLPMLVSVKYKGEWKFIDYFPTAGISNSRDLIMNINLEEFKDSSKIQLRLQTTYMFWDLDYAAMDFSTSNVCRTENMTASTVSLVNRDNESIYPEDPLQHSNIFVKGPFRLDLEFNIHPSLETGMKNSYFLAGNGYYHDNSRFEGEARVGELSRFSGKGAFDKYSREKFEFLLGVMRENKNNVIFSSK